MTAPRFFAIFLPILLFLATLPAVHAQEGSTGKTGKESTHVSRPKDPPKWEPVQPPAFETPYVPQQVPERIIIQGKVIQEDGGPPPFGTIIERECGPVVTKEILVDSNGFYSFVVGDANRTAGLLVDASENFYYNTMPSTFEYGMAGFQGWFQDRSDPLELIGCVLRAHLDGYHSTDVHLAIGQSMGLVEVGTILVYPVSRVTGTSVSATNLKAPKAAKDALKQGIKSFEKKELGKAEALFREAVAIYPSYSDAWIELGWLYQSEKRIEDARRCYRTASDADKSYVSPYIRLAQLSALENNWAQTVEYSGKALSLDPVSYPDAYFLHALAYYRTDQLEQAEKSVRQGIRIDLGRNIPQMHLMLANIRTKKSDPAGSMEAMRQYLKIRPNAPGSDQIRILVREQEKSLRASQKK